MKRIGIEAINLYGGSLYLDQMKLAEARGQDPAKVVSDFLIDTRSLNPPFEDTVTMAANAARPLFDYAELSDVGMLIVGTEGSVDFGKPISTNIHGALGLPSSVRNYETKHACYSGVAALDTAINWIASGLNHGKKALVISTDFSRMHLGAKEEFVLGGVAAALIVSDSPRVVEYELERRGTWTTDAYDTFRPSARAEVGNNEVSLFTYMDAIEGAFEEFALNSKGGVDFDADFEHLNYHTPFPGMAFQAHRTLCNISKRRSKPEVVSDFERRVAPGLKFARRVGSTYGSSNFVGIASLFSEDSVRAGSRIGFFAYGSGAIGEFYSGVACEEASEVVGRMDIGAHLDDRVEVTVELYERIEQERESYIEMPNFSPTPDGVPGLFETSYDGKKRLVLRNVENYYRSYEWS